MLFRSARALAAVTLLAVGAIAGAGVVYLLDRGDKVQPPVAPRAAVVAPPSATSATAPATPQALVKDPAATDSMPLSAPQPAKGAPAPEKPAARQLTADQLRRLEGYLAGGNRLLRERLAATRERLQVEPDASYSIELFVAENSDPARAERFLLRASDLVPLSEVHVIPVATGSRYLLRVAYGAYPGMKAATEAATRLPPKYQNAFRFGLRSFAELRAAI